MTGASPRSHPHSGIGGYIPSTVVFCPCVLFPALIPLLEVHEPSWWAQIEQVLLPIQALFIHFKTKGKMTERGNKER
jgi:hypothetical protein